MIRQFIMSQLILIHAGEAAVRIKSTFILAASISPIAFVLDQITHWTITNNAYVLFVFAAIICDHILGSLVHLFVKRDFTIKKNIIGLVIKIGLVVVVGLLFEGVNHIVEGDNFLKDYLIILLRLLVFMYPAGSAFVNSSIITNGKFPPSGFLSKLARFQENLNIEELKKDVQDQVNKK